MVLMALAWAMARSSMTAASPRRGRKSGRVRLGLDKRGLDKRGLDE